MALSPFGDLYDRISRAWSNECLKNLRLHCEQNVETRTDALDKSLLYLGSWLLLPLLLLQLIAGGKLLCSLLWLCRQVALRLWQSDNPGSDEGQKRSRKLHDALMSTTKCSKGK